MTATLPCNRPSDFNPLKRPRPEEESESEPEYDYMTFGSRSPSPASKDHMDVDQKYEDRIREVITVDSKIKSSNKGFALLTKLGWHQGQPLGLSADGRTEPIPFHIQSNLAGLGKTNMDFQTIETVRRELDSEKQSRETDEQRKVPENVARNVEEFSAVGADLKPCYCEICKKQLESVAQCDEHTTSCAHHRQTSMQATNRIMKFDKRKETELRKMAASGVKMSKSQSQETDGMCSEACEISNGGPGRAYDTSGSCVFSTSGDFEKPRTKVGSVPIPPPSHLPSGEYLRPAMHIGSFRSAGWTTLETAQMSETLR